MILRALAVAVAVAVLAGCGGGTHGTATLWVTRDEGHTLLLSRTVPAGETAMQALERSAHVSTRYGGRFVQSVNGISGSISSRHDWFYFVNGIEADRGAADYVLHPGDVEWWDYRDWGRYGQSVPVVVGAFPEPFLHGYDGQAPTAVVVAPRDTPTVRKIVRLIHATFGGDERASPASRSAYALVIEPNRVPPRFYVEQHGRAITFFFVGDPRKLLDPSLYRHRYRVP